MVPCSVLMCVYGGDRPEYFREAMQSILGQTVAPGDVVIVVDGAISDGLNVVLEEFEGKNNVQVVRLPRNIGVGAASNRGLEHCKYEFVAKMDADDVAVPNRLELQLAAFERDADLTLVGGQLAEFSGDVKNVVSYRRVPTGERDIRKFARRRSPFNNQTVMYKKSAVLEMGGYPKLNRAEDYYLYVKLMVNGYKVKNLKDVLVCFRLDDEAYRRRKTWRHTKEIIGARNEIRKLGASNVFDLVIVAVVQIMMFLLPVGVVKNIYEKGLRK